MATVRTRLGWAAAAASVFTLTPRLWAQANAGPRVRLLDLNRTGQSALSAYLDAQSFAVAGGHVYFPAWSFAEGYELWRSDGTNAGTTLVADLMPGTLSSGPGQLVAAGGQMCFVASDSGGVPQIYVDHLGNGVGTGFSTRITSFSIDDNTLPSLVGAAGEHLIYTAPAGDQIGLWSVLVASGSTTPPSPTLLMRLISSPVGAGFGGSDATSLGGWLYFAADDGVRGRELWRTDGTPAGTTMVIDLVAGPLGSDPAALVPVNGKLFFSAVTPEAGREPWVWDIDGPRPLGNLNASGAGTAGSSPDGFMVLGSQVVFVATDPSRGRELWTTSVSGDATTTQPLLDISPGSADGVPGAFRPVRIGSHIYFAARDAAGGTELWRTDGTPQGTDRHADIRSGPSGSEPVQLLESAGRLVFQAVTDDSGYRLWIAEPADAGVLGVPRRLSNVAFTDDDAINRSSARPCVHLPAAGGVLVFPGFRLATGLELHRVTSPTAYAELVRDIRLGTLGSSPSQFARLGDGAVFSARNELGVEPWTSTGDGPGTRPLADLLPGRSGSNPGPFLVDPHTQVTMFRASGAAGGQWFQAHMAPAPALVPLGLAEAQQSVTPRSCELGQIAVFSARRSDTGDEPFFVSLGGGPPAPQLLADIVPGIGSSSPFFFSRVGNAAIFFAAATSGAAGASVELWRVDAGPSDARRIARITNPVGTRVVSTANRPVSIGPCLFFVADDGSGDELWVSRVDTGQTFRIADIEPGSRSSFPTSLCSSIRADGRQQLAFVAQRSDIGAEVWAAVITTQGVTASLVSDLFPGPAASSPVSLMSPRGRDGQPLAGGGVYFCATDGLTGRQLWFTTGEPGNTSRLTNLNASAGVAVQAVLGVLGGGSSPLPRQAFLRVLDPAAAPGGTSLLGSLYRTDASAQGASPVLNGSAELIVPGSTVLEVNSRVYLSVTDRLAGAELAVLDLCPSDFDNSGQIELNDLFDFLASWLGSYGQVAPVAPDVSYDGRVDMHDLFSFLDSYFRGCR